MRFTAIVAAFAFAITANAAVVGNTFEERDALAEADWEIDDLEFTPREAEAEPELIFARAKCGAQIKKVPKCARGCIRNASGSVGCGANDHKCQCKHFGALQKKSRACVIRACGVSGALKARKASKKVCKCLGV